MAHEQEHKGTFAEGQAREEHHPEDEPEGDFGRGQERAHEHEHVSDFAEGQAREERHREDEEQGDFADGQERDSA